jgi:hypothetical protein
MQAVVVKEARAMGQRWLCQRQLRWGGISHVDSSGRGWWWVCLDCFEGERGGAGGGDVLAVLTVLEDAGCWRDQGGGGDGAALAASMKIEEVVVTPH